MGEAEVQRLEALVAQGKEEAAALAEASGDEKEQLLTARVNEAEGRVEVLEGAVSALGGKLESAEEQLASALGKAKMAGSLQKAPDVVLDCALHLLWEWWL